MFVVTQVFLFCFHKTGNQCIDYMLEMYNQLHFILQSMIFDPYTIPLRDTSFPFLSQFVPFPIYFTDGVLSVFINVSSNQNM